MPVLVIGSTNEKKRREIAELLQLPGLVVESLAAYADVPEIVEDGDTFRANAEKKAITLAKHLNRWVLGEDSGLCVDALGGAPGIYSARYAGEPCNDEANNDKLLAALADVPDEQRTAFYHCTAVIADPAGTIRAAAEGQCRGQIIRERRGSGGFGYDPLFLIPAEGKTFGELPASFKQATSHRSQALTKLRPQLVELLHSGQWTN